MPPSLPTDSDNILVKSPEPYYTNDDVAILHDIVVHAQELLPSLPERERLPTNALFHAYHSILPSVGIDADHDSRYARILFKIGGTRSEGSLYKKFEAVLARMGIEIQFDQENDGNGDGEAGGEDYTMEDSQDQGAEFPHDTEFAPPAAYHQSGRNRSSSGDPALEPEHKRSEEDSSRHRASSSASTAHSEHAVNRINTPLSLPPKPVQLSVQQFSQTQSDGEQSQERDYGLRAWLNDNGSKYPKRTRTRSSSTHGSMRIRRISPPALQQDVQTPSISRPNSESFLAIGTDQQQYLDVERQRQPEISKLTSEDLADAQVLLIGKLRIENLTRRFMFKWHQKTLQLQEDNNNLETLARHQDRRVLLRQAFDSWHVAIGERRHIAETERFFAHLERRAGRARDLFLMAKAITHWACNASNEMQRTSAARRHILRVRYFSAWRDMTAVNELKVRRQVLRKFYPLWQKHSTTTLTNKERALAYFTDNLVQRIFWSWFWAFCESRAPTWRSNRLLRKEMALWAAVANEQRKDDVVAVDHHCHTITRKTYLLWSTKARDYASHTSLADEYRRISLCHKALDVWRHGSALLPRLHYLLRKVTSRHKHDSLKLWVVRASHESHAKTIDRSKIMREAWVTWNDKLRCRSLQSKINDRLALQGLYKWVLGERLGLGQRQKERQLMQMSIQKLTEALHSSTVKESRDMNMAQEMFVRKLGTRALRNWRTRQQSHLQDQRVALEFNSPLLLADSLARWSIQRERIGQLQTWARNGVFYFVASKTIKSWKHAMEAVKKEKRRLAYTQFRRKYKTDLARKAFSRWHRQASSFAHSYGLAAELRRNKSVVFCIEAFNRWRARIEEVAELDFMRKRSLLDYHLNLLNLRLVSRRSLEKEAVAVFGEHAVALCMKKWGRVSLQLRARRHLVFELQEKRLKKACRRVLAHWLQRSSQGHHLAGIRDKEKSNLRSPNSTASWVESLDDGNVDEWVDGVDDLATPTAMPGYLSTPSRRILRAKASSRLPSTTPSAPLPTPIERQLREHYSGGPLPSFRKRIGRSLLGQDGTALDIEEESRIGTQEDSTE